MRTAGVGAARLSLAPSPRGPCELRASVTTSVLQLPKPRRQEGTELAPARTARTPQGRLDAASEPSASARVRACVCARVTLPLLSQQEMGGKNFLF